MSTLHVNLDLIRKYNVAGPRYTSYPPATQFKARENETPWREKMAANNARHPARDLSLYFHLPFCRSLCWYCGCTTVITRAQKQSAKYLAYIEKELEMMAALLDPRRKVVQIHLGGGTPTFLLPEELRALGAMIRKRFSIAAKLDAGVEIDPRFLTEEQVAALRESGFNRASIGVQDIDPKVQVAVHRVQPKAVTEQVVRWLRESGFGSLNIDLIYGLPNQTTASFEKTLEAVLELNPDRLAVFSYAHVPWIKPAQKILERASLPSAEMKLDLLKITIEKLTANGFVYIGMDHFAKEQDELSIAQREGKLRRNFQGYSTHSGVDIYGFGMSSISQADDFYWQNEKELPAYYGRLDAGELPIAKDYYLSEDECIRRRTIMRLMCDLGLNYEKMTAEIGHPFPEYFHGEISSLQSMADDGLIDFYPGGIRVTDLGRLLIRNIAMRFDPLTTQTTNKFSRTI